MVRDFLFLKISTTFEVFRGLGNFPVSRDLFMSLEIVIDISSQMSFKILTGILLGLLDFDTEMDLIILMISSGMTG